jgi:hypothetical protein
LNTPAPDAAVDIHTASKSQYASRTGSYRTIFRPYRTPILTGLP